VTPVHDAALSSLQVEMLSGGELQRFAIGIVAVQDADVYMFDEPSSYLDVKQRLKVRRCCCSVPRVLPSMSGAGYS
jgi:translation initiation factor RLI1